MPKVSVLLSEGEDARFAAYCSTRGHKKSTLIVRLIKEHMDREGFGAQTQFSFAQDTFRRGDAGALPERRDEGVPTS